MLTTCQPFVRSSPAPLMRLKCAAPCFAYQGSRVLLLVRNASVANAESAGIQSEHNNDAVALDHSAHSIATSEMHSHGHDGGQGQPEGGHSEHGHGGVQGAVHQVQHRAAEKSAFKFLEAVAERLTSKQVMQHVGSKVLSSAAEKAGERIGERAGERLVERLAERAGERLTERVGERVLERAGERVAERAGERLAERMGERMAERVAERTGERMAERAGERLAERMGERMAERAGERLAERMGERIAERAGERMAERTGERLAERAGERLAERVAERAGERMAERFGEQALTKGGTRVGTHAAEALAGHLFDPTAAASEHIATATAKAAATRAAKHGASGAAHGVGSVAAHGTGSRGGLTILDMAIQKVLGSRLGKRILTPQLLARVGRGAMVALPAIGAFFVAHLAHQDYERMVEERAHGHFAPFLGFLLAFTFDVLDVLAHIVVVVGLMHQHFQIGLHVSHSVLHQVEGAGIAIAVISTVAAAVAEILAMRRGLATTNATAVGPYAGHSVIPTATIKSPVPSVDPIRQYMEGAAVAASSSTTTSTCGTHISVSTEAGRSDIVSVAAIGVTSAGFHRKKSGEQSPSNGHLGTQSVEAATAAAGVAGAVTAAGASGSASTIVALDHNGNPFGRVMSSSWHDSSFRSTAH